MWCHLTRRTRSDILCSFVSRSPRDLPGFATGRGNVPLSSTDSFPRSPMGLPDPRLIPCVGTQIASVSRKFIKHSAATPFRTNRQRLSPCSNKTSATGYRPTQHGGMPDGVSTVLRLRFGHQLYTSLCEESLRYPVCMTQEHAFIGVEPH
ncbi:unnamed protein product [Protopolystoma xenopodis]|uniref:Uncharacterized protein n=1 Tax=Protopolystoma xenopodis TaxID=117903 RepID=A0A3S4ZBG0_9PLAT|nr:unnamed protein product [Protopolystoma xenopodis]